MKVLVELLNGSTIELPDSDEAWTSVTYAVCMRLGMRTPLIRSVKATNGYGTIEREWYNSL